MVKVGRRCPSDPDTHCSILYHGPAPLATQCQDYWELLTTAYRLKQRAVPRCGPLVSPRYSSFWSRDRRHTRFTGASTTRLEQSCTGTSILTDVVTVRFTMGIGDGNCQLPWRTQLQRSANPKTPGDALLHTCRENVKVVKRPKKWSISGLDNNRQWRKAYRWRKIGDSRIG